MYKIILILIYSISFQIVAQNQVLDLDGNQYDIINIGGQVWFKQNLRTTKFSNGEIIPNSIGNGTWAIEGMPAWCYWYNDSVNQYPQGTLYNWYSVNDSRNICPQGWKVPTVADWTILFANFGGNQLAGEALKDTGTIENGTGLWHAPNLATNISDFTCVPLGYRSQNGTFGGGMKTLGTGQIRLTSMTKRREFI